MLPTLSPTAWQIIEQLAADPKRSVHLRGLMKLTGKSPSPVQKAVRELEQTHIIGASSQGNRKLFHINVNYELYPTLKKMAAAGYGDEPTHQGLGRHAGAPKPTPTITVSPDEEIELAYHELGLAKQLIHSNQAVLHHCGRAIHHVMNAVLATHNLAASNPKHAYRSFHGAYIAPGQVPQEWVEHLEHHFGDNYEPADTEEHLEKTVEFIMLMHTLLNDQIRSTNVEIRNNI
ncbi:Lrp/AsnC family transcriptional regulator [Candidatus Berkelbacteria bacterium]|nr:Lrp/AsnC family transcriptional regulator [Candidatus Berkelbacteria bacterium]